MPELWKISFSAQRQNEYENSGGGETYILKHTDAAIYDQN